MTAHALKSHGHLTFRGNLKSTRYGWLRLTPAYSVHLVSDVLSSYEPDNLTVLDPFCGTGTTALVCAERGIACDTTDINPFLIWLTKAKTARYSSAEIGRFSDAARRVAAAMHGKGPEWHPPLHQIEKWWPSEVLSALGRGAVAIKTIDAHARDPGVLDLLRIAFCRAVIETSNASFGHQSMSLRKDDDRLRLFGEENPVHDAWDGSVRLVATSAASAVEAEARALLCDARRLTGTLPRNRYGLVITSPPYPNRMSYIRELRPYMYWLGYLSNGRDAAELDWQAIGGTWGVATSRVAKWEPEEDRPIPFEGFELILQGIASSSPLLSRYVHKYFYDMVEHCAELLAVVKPGGAIHYIVGNSKFYDVMLPVEAIYASLFAAAGFEHVSIEAVRKRSSKKELFEFVVSARKPD